MRLNTVRQIGRNHRSTTAAGFAFVAKRTAAIGVESVQKFATILLVLFGVSTIPAAAGDDSAKQVDQQHSARMRLGLDVFRRRVRPVLIGRCVKCHGGASTESEFDLNTREGLLKGGAEGPAVVLGDAQASRLYRLSAHLDEPQMPEDGAKLNDRALASIAKWIELGAPYDKPLAEKDDDPLAWTKRKIEPTARDYWAFRPLRIAKPPLQPNPWSRNDIDAFILSELTHRGMTPNPPADRRTLIRRAYFDVIGLPPEPEAVERFIDDASDNAMENMVDRLLENPHYGERWARHWLDVVRFAESHGFEQDYDRPHAFHYRDFVIKALNADMPYDQFVRWQLAGDEFAPEDPLAMMATGFLGAGVFPTQLTEKEFEPARYDALDDMVATIGTSMLGLTIGCARCHDHKYDPIPAADYYRLLATFGLTIRGNIELDLNSGELKPALEKWQTEFDRLKAELAAFERRELPSRFEQWRAHTSKAKPSDAGWIVVRPTLFQSAGGATLTQQDDGSLLVGGTNPDFDKYTLVVETDLTNLTAMRLEALSHKSMVRGGPGRAGNGNMGLGNLAVTAEPISGNGKPIEVRLVDPRATFQQNSNNLSIAASIDDNPRTGWAVDPQFGKDHAAAFRFEKPIGFAGGTRLTFTLEFNVNNKHNIGRPRLSVCQSNMPLDLTGNGTSHEVLRLRDALKAADGELSAEQRNKMLVWYRPLDDDWRSLNQKVQDHLQRKPKPQLTKVMVASEGLKPIPHHADGRGFPHFYKQTFYLRRGDTQQKQGVAEPGFLQVLSREETEDRWQDQPPANWRTSYRRRSLANWMTDTESGAGQLLARVIVNRLWQHHFGRGIVATPNDFGSQGEPPTHPELLDWLAARLVAGRWRLKPIHRLMLTSAAYLQSAEFDQEHAAIDPENRFLWRYAPRRLEAEAIRDAMLSVSGQWDPTMYGAGTLDESMKRRSIYFMIKRSKLVPMMQLFDAPEPLVSQGRRPATTIAPQALLFMNNPRVRGYARGLAKRVTSAGEPSVESAINTAYQLALCRSAEDAELADAVRFVNDQMSSYGESGRGDAYELAITDWCQVLFSLNEFVFVD